jgi:hypothetical protein
MTDQITVPTGTLLAIRRESARELCGLHTLRGWSNAKDQQILPGGA